MTDRTWLAEQFETFRPRLQSVAYNMLGSVSDAEDAVQECWIRLDRSDSDAIQNLGTWLTTVVGRICLDLLRARKSHREDYVGTWLPEPLVQEPREAGPEHQAELADTLGLALLVVLETLSPAERLAFVLHDIFGVSFQAIGEIIDRSAIAARQLASRARHRVRAAPKPDADVTAHRQIVDAFLVAARGGDFEALLSILAPNCVLRFDIGADIQQGPVVGASNVARRILATAPRFISFARPIIVNGAAGLIFDPGGQALAVLGFTVVSGRVQALDLIIDPAKLGHLTTEPMIPVYRRRGASPRLQQRGRQAGDAPPEFVGRFRCRAVGDTYVDEHVVDRQRGVRLEELDLSRSPRL